MLHLAILDAPNGTMIMDVSDLIHNAGFSTNAHGFATLTANADLTLVRAFQLYDRPGLPHVVLSDGANVVFEGRLEDVSITDPGARLMAFGYWRALSDLPYTALWSDTSVAAWRALTTADRTDARTEKWTTDTNNRLFIAPQKGEAYTTTTPGWLGYAAPHRGARNIARVTFSYDLTASGDYRGRLIAVDTSFAGTPTTEWSLVGNSGSQTGTATITIGGANTQYLYFQLEALSGVTYTGETGDWYLKITNIRVMSTTASTVTVDAIATALASYVNGINSSQLGTATTLIAAPGLDLTDEVYEDEYPADILTRLTGLGDDQTPPRQWECGVWENRLLHLRERGAAARAWLVDAGSLDVERSLATLVNAAYGVYRDPNSQTQRTTTATDAGSIARFALTRRAAVPASTTSSTQAGVQRDAFLEDRAIPPTRAEIKIPVLYDEAGGRWPLWMARSGDTITIRNLPPTLSLDVDRIRTFRIAETAYSCDTNVLSVTPELPRPSLEVMVARLGSGLAR
jgi:hypothetical protein